VVLSADLGSPGKVVSLAIVEESLFEGLAEVVDLAVVNPLLAAPVNWLSHYLRLFVRW